MLVSPVQVGDQALVVAAQHLAQQLLVFPIQAQVIGDGEGLQREAGDGLHQLEAVQVQTEVIPRLHSSGHDPSVLQLHLDKHTVREPAGLSQLNTVRTQNPHFVALVSFSLEEEEVTSSQPVPSEWEQEQNAAVTSSSLSDDWQQTSENTELKTTQRYVNFLFPALATFVKLSLEFNTKYRKRKRQKGSKRWHSATVPVPQEGPSGGRQLVWWSAGSWILPAASHLTRGKHKG